MDIEAALAVIDLEIAKLNEARCLPGGETGPSKPPLRRRRVLSAEARADRGRAEGPLGEGSQSQTQRGMTDTPSETFLPGTKRLPTTPNFQRRNKTPA